MRPIIRRFPVLAFVTLTLGYQFGIMAFIWWRTRHGFELHDDPIGHMVFRFRVLGPLVFATLLTVYIDGRTGLKALYHGFTVWKVHPKWYMLAFSWKFLFTWAGIATLAVLGIRQWPGFFIEGLFGDVQTMKNLAGAMPFIVLIAFVEETSWMKYCATRLQDKYAAAPACLLTGIGWALWYMPMLLVGEGVPDGYPVPVFMTSMVALAVLLGWAYNMTRSGLVLLGMQIISNCAFFILPVLPGMHEMDATYVNSFVAANVVSATFLILFYGWRQLGTGVRATWSESMAELDPTGPANSVRLQKAA